MWDNKLKRVLLAGVAACAFTPAAAQEAAPSVSSSDEIVVTGRYGAEAAVTGTKIATPLIEIPQSVGVVTSQLLEERRPANLNEALYNVSGIADTGSRRAFDNLVIRGFTGSFSVYLDGLRVERGNFNVPQEVWGLERIEVLKGPGSVLYGQGSLGGIVNQVSKTPTEERRFAIEAAAGSFGTLQGGVDIGGALGGGWSARVVGLFRNLEESIDFNDRQRLYISPSLRWANAQSSITFLANYTRDRNDATYVGVPAEGSVLPNPNGRLDRQLYIGEPSNDLVDVDRFQIGYQARHDFGGGLSISQNLRYSTSDVLSKATFSSGFNPDFRTLRRGSAIFALDDQSFAIDTNLQYEFAGNGYENTIMAGVDLLHQNVDSSFDFSSFPALDLYAPVYGRPMGPIFPIQNFRQKDRLYGLYLQNQLKLGDRLTLLAGLRYDATNTYNFNRLNSQGRRQKDDDVTLRFGAIYQVSPGIGVFANYAEAFNPNFGLDAFGEPFDAETGTQYEGGIKTDLSDGRVRGTFALYRLVRDNVLVAFPQFPGAQVQTGQQRSQGVEVDLAVDLTSAWSVTLAYAHTDVEVRKDTNAALIGDRPVSVPSHQANLWTSYDLGLGDGMLQIAGGGRYVGKREGTLPNSYALPSFVVADAAVTYRIDRWRLQANVYNLFDRNYIASASPTGQRSVLLGEPLTVRFTVGYGF